MRIEVVYAGPELEFIEQFEVPAGTTALEAVRLSRLLEQNASVSLDKNSLGIFGREVRAETILQENDRVEVYRPLKKDPKESRRLRASMQLKD